MKFQLILSASALLLSTVPAAFAGAPYTTDDIVPLEDDVFGFDLEGDGNYDGGSSSSSSSVDGILMEGNGDGTLLDPAAFSDAFVAIPNPFAGNNNAAFRNGRQTGVRQAERVWQRLGGTCRRAWSGYPDAITRIIQRVQRARQSDRNDGRIAGLRQELQRRMFECNSNSRNPNPPRPNGRIPNPRNPQVCIRFGEEAARRIAWDFCNPSPLLGSHQGSWRRDCRDVAINQCKGQVTTEVQNQCGLPRSTRTLRQLQDQCADKVDSMIRSSSGRGKTEKEEMMLS